MGKFINLTGQKFERLTVVSKELPDSTGSIIWKCKCECGKDVYARGNALRKGLVKSCGCYKKDILPTINTKYKDCPKRLYKIYYGMLGRCYSEGNSAYNNYGGRGIQVCSEWKNSFTSFWEWSINNGYSAKLSIDRKDNEAEYSPDNCRWVSDYEQSRNKRSSVFLTLNNKTLPIEIWAKDLNLKLSTLYTRKFRGWSDHEILTISTDRSTLRNT